MHIIFCFRKKSVQTSAVYKYFFSTQETKKEFIRTIMNIQSSFQLILTWTVRVIGAQHSVWPYPSTIKHPSAHLVNVRTFPAKGAEPTTISLTLPPVDSLILLKTSLSHMLLFLIIPFLISASFARIPRLNTSFFKHEFWSSVWICKMPIDDYARYI